MHVELMFLITPVKSVLLLTQYTREAPTLHSCKVLLLDDTQQSYYTGGCQQQVLCEGHALSQQGRVWADGGGRGRGGGSGGRAITIAHWARTRKGQCVCGEGGGAGAEEDPRPASHWLGPLYPAENRWKVHRQKQIYWEWTGREMRRVVRSTTTEEGKKDVTDRKWKLE